MGTSKPPPGHRPGVIPGSDWTFGINATSPNSLTDATLLEGIGLMLREYYSGLAEEPMPDHLLKNIERFPTEPRGTNHDPPR
jgi:hypothetical protein